MDQSVGKTLREAREERAIELAEVEASTRIRCGLLRAIEQDDWAALPGEAYTRGFIRTYADYLGLDGKALAERHRLEVGADRPGESLLRADPKRPRRPKPPRRQPSPRLLAAIVSAAVLAVLIAAGLSGGDEDGSAPRRPARTAPPPSTQETRSPATRPPRSDSRLSLQLTATGEVWVCLLDSGGQPLVEGQILAAGAEAGPFRSGSFTVALGNGAVAMTVNGKEASIPSTPSPIGYTIDAGGALRELPEGERPTCT